MTSPTPSSPVHAPADGAGRASSNIDSSQSPPSSYSDSTHSTQSPPSSYSDSTHSTQSPPSSYSDSSHSTHSTHSTHNNLYAVLQASYLKTGDPRTLGRMYKIAREAAYNYISVYFFKKRLPFRDAGAMSHDAALFVIEQYLKKPGFQVGKISAYIHFGVLKELFRNKRSEMCEISYEGLVEKGLKAGVC